jgi:hypothetical protein
VPSARSISDPPFEKAVSSVGSLPMPSIADLFAHGTTPTTQRSESALCPSVTQGKPRPLGITNYVLVVRGSRGAQDRRLSRFIWLGSGEHSRHYRLQEATRAERTNLARRRSFRARHSPLMQHVARSRCAAETFRARDAQVTTAIPFDVTVGAA